MSTFSFQDDYQVHVPTGVLQRQFDNVDALNAELKQVIQDLETKFRDSPENAVNSGLISTQGGYQTSTDMNLFQVGADCISQFVDKLLMPAVQPYLQHIFGEDSKVLAPHPIGWSNVLDAGNWQGPHSHPTPSNLASGVYYVQIPEDKPAPEGCIEFLNPIPQSLIHGHPSTRRLHPKEGLMVLFPPYYNHYVHPFSGEGRRIIIAFDILASPPKPQFVF